MAISKVTPDLLAFYIEHNLNVMFEGKHGVGKTHLVLEAFRNANLRFLYFSGATLDPWISLVGIPRPMIDKASGLPYLDLVRPKDIVLGDVQAMFIDEYNRAPKQVRNAVMELIQFGTINGFPLKNLKVIWIAVNPANDESDTDSFDYDVEDLDPAQRDRFHVHIQIPYEPSLEFFVKEFGETQGSLAVDWWHQLSDVAKKITSPRRLEYALAMFNRGGDVASVLGKEANPKGFEAIMKEGPLLDRIIELYEAGDANQAKYEIQSNPNMIDCIFGQLDRMPEDASDFWIPLLETDSIMAAIGQDDNLLYFVVSRVVKHKVFAYVITAVIKANLENEISWKTLASLICPINTPPQFAKPDSSGRSSGRGHSRPLPVDPPKSVANSIATNPYQVLLADILTKNGIPVVVSVDELKAFFSNIQVTRRSSDSEKGEYAIKLCQQVLNITTSVTSLSYQDVRDNLPGWYVDAFSHIADFVTSESSLNITYRVSDTSPTTKQGKGKSIAESPSSGDLVTIPNPIGLVLRTLLFTMAKTHNTYHIGLIYDSLPDIVRQALSVIQTVSKGGFGGSHIPTTNNILVRARTTKKWKSGRPSKRKT